jgi:hypothetical protein
MPETDLLGTPTTEVERELLGAYETLKALATLWQVTNNLDLQFEQIVELGA